MLIGDIGDVRSGKTLLLTKFATNLVNIPENRDKGFQAFANFHINDKRVRYITVDDFVNLNLAELNSGLVVMQEFWAWLYAKLSSSLISRGINPIINQSGKLGFDIMWDSQLASNLDRNVRLLTEKFWVARPKLYNREVKFHPKLLAFRYVYSTNKTLMRYTFPLKKKDKATGKIMSVAERYFSLYNTREQAEMLYQGQGTTLGDVKDQQNTKPVSLPNSAVLLDTLGVPVSHETKPISHPSSTDSKPSLAEVISKTQQFKASSEEILSSKSEIISPFKPNNISKKLNPETGKFEIPDVFATSKEGNRINEVQQQIAELTQEQKDKMNLETGFNTIPPLTTVPEQYGHKKPLKPEVLETLIKEGRVQEMSLE